MELESLVEKYAVKNAIEHGGNCQTKAVLGKVLAENSELKDKVKEVKELVEEVVEEVNQLDIDKQRQLAGDYEYKEKEKQEDKLPELPGAEEGQVVMRMAPFPSGPLHIGNARMAVLNDEYVKRYDGKLLLVIDDTAGSEAKRPIKEAYEMIPHDLEWLGVDFDQIICKSDRMDTFYEYARKFLEEGWAYVCHCSREQLRKNRREGVACSHRDKTPEENLEDWEKMLEGDYDEGEAIVRLKTDMQAPDPAFRDRTLLRVKKFDHPRVGSQYRVWPMLEFSWAIDDQLLGMTHIIRGQDLVMEDRMEQYMWDLLGWEEKEILHHGLFSLEGVDMSTSQSRRKIAEGDYTGWEDPRTWSLASLRKRGFKPEAIRKFVLSFGLSNSDVEVPLSNLYEENRKLIDREAERFFFVPNPEKITVNHAPDLEEVEVPVHPESDETRTINLRRDKQELQLYLPASDTDEDFLRLKNLFNLEIKARSDSNLEVEYAGRDHELALERNASIVQWVPSDGKQCEVVMPDGERVKGLVEGVQELSEGQVVQFVRFGFVRIDSLSKDKIKAYFAHS